MPVFFNQIWQNVFMFQSKIFFLSTEEILDLVEQI